MRFAFVGAALAAVAMTAPAAEARGFGRFGDEDNFHRIQDLVVPDAARSEVPVEWATGAELDSHTITHWMGGGAWLEDKGYAIRVPGSDTYWNLDADAIATLQGLKVLPDPLPKYEIPMMDYLFGYSLWIIIGVLALWYGGSALLKRRSA